MNRVLYSCRNLISPGRARSTLGTAFILYIVSINVTRTVTLFTVSSGPLRRDGVPRCCLPGSDIIPGVSTSAADATKATSNNMKNYCKIVNNLCDWELLIFSLQRLWTDSAEDTFMNIWSFTKYFNIVKNFFVCELFKFLFKKILSRLRSTYKSFWSLFISVWIVWETYQQRELLQNR